MTALACEDGGALVLCLVSSITVLYGCAYSLNVIFPDSTELKEVEAEGENRRTRDEREMPVIANQAVLIIVCSMIVLFSLLYSPNGLIIVIKSAVFLSSVTSVTFVLRDWFNLIFRAGVCAIIAMAFAIAITLLWFATGHWLLADLIVFCNCVCCISCIRVRSLRLVIGIGIGFMVCEVWWVFFAPEWLMKAVTEMSYIIPAVLAIPYGGRMPTAGAGWIAVAGVVLNFFIHLDARVGSSLFTVGFSGYVIGNIGRVVVMILTKTQQPSLLWVLPAVMGSTLGIAYRNGNGVWGAPALLESDDLRLTDLVQITEEEEET